MTVKLTPMKCVPSTCQLTLRLHLHRPFTRLSGYLCNARSVVCKLSELHALLYFSSYDLIFITETWLNKNVSCSLLDPNSTFTVIRNDRNDARGGGVCALIRKCSSYRVLSINIGVEFSDAEILCFDLIVSDRFIVAYRPPSFDVASTSYMRMLVKCLTKYSSNKYSNVLVGDFNLPKMSWLSGHYSCPDIDIYNQFLTFVTDLGYIQVVDFPTRGNNVLDLLLTTEPSLFTAVKSECPFGSSDYSTVISDIVLPSVWCTGSPSLATGSSYDWYLGDFDAIGSFLEGIDWFMVVCDHASASDAWSTFVSILRTAIDLYVPCRHTNNPHKPERKLHCPRALRKCTTKKRQLWQYLKANPCDSHALTKYRDCVYEWRYLAQQKEMTIENQIISANDVGRFYKFVNRRVSNRSEIGAVCGADGEPLSSDILIADAFNEYFASVGVRSNNVIPDLGDCHVPKLTMVDVNDTVVLAAIKKLKSNLSAGPDGLPPLLFKCISHAIALPLTLMFQLMLSVAFVPPDWKKAVIRPVHKKGPTSIIGNYRPISLVCVPCKLLERVVVNVIYKHLTDNNILRPEQHGFVHGLSTCTNLLESLNDLTNYCDGGGSTIVIYIDFCKAFDVVQHDKLFARLQSYGIDGVLLQWIKNLFCSRTFCTKVNNLLSGVVCLISGVIQGSVIGPLMFLVYINDLVILLSRFNIRVKLFADDVKMYLKVTNCSDVCIMRKALSALASWADQWQLTVSVSKCGVMHMGKNLPVQQFSFNNDMLPPVSANCDLGISITSELSPSMHVSNIVSKAHQRSNLILRCFVSRDVELLKRAYVTYVRPLLEYNSVVWSPWLKQDITAIERVPRRFTKRLRGLHNRSYEERLKILQLESLEYRRIFNDLVWCYKIVFGVVRVKMSDFFSLRSGATHGHPYKLFKSFSRSSTR